MISVNGIGDGQGEDSGTPEQGPEKELPEMDPRSIFHTQQQNGFEKHHTVTEMQTDVPPTQAQTFLAARPVVPQKRLDPLEIRFGRVDALDDLAVTVYQFFITHFRRKIDGEIGVVAGHVFAQTPFLGHPLIKPGAARRIEQTHHSGDNFGFLDKLDLLGKYRRRIIVESHDKPALHLDAGFLNFLHASHQIAVFVLKFRTFRQARFIGGLDAHEYFIEPGPHHEIHQLFIVSQVDGGFG